jgi:hypothetical protein
MAALCPAPDQPLTQSCVGGSCVDAQTCLCADGFTGFGDFVVGSPSCTISIMAVQALWSVLAIAQFASLLFALFFVRLTARHSRANSTFGGLASILSSICFIALGIWRAADPLGTPIGTHPGSTALFCLGASLFWTFTLWSTKTFLEMSLKQARMYNTESQQRVNRLMDILHGKGLAILAGMIVLVCWFPILMLATTDEWAVYGLGVVHYIGLVLAALFIGLLAAPSLVPPIISDIEAAIARSRSMNQDTEQLTTVAGKLKRLVLTTRNQGIFNAVFASPFGLWPLLQHLSCYWLPVAFTAGALGVMQGLYTEMPVRRNKSAQRVPTPVPGQSETGGSSKLSSARNETSVYAAPDEVAG